MAIYRTKVAGKLDEQGEMYLDHLQYHNSFSSYMTELILKIGFLECLTLLPGNGKIPPA